MILVNDLRISLDRREADADIDFVSHAHSDHTSSVKSSKSVYASDETVSLVESLHGKKVNRVAEVPKSISMIDAGHIFGSKQIVIDDESSGSRTVYTGDFMMQKSRTCGRIVVKEADTVIVDSTFPYPEIVFGERSETETAIQRWTDSRLKQGIVLFGVYATGKAQEITAVLNEEHIVPAVSKKISMVNGVCKSHGLKLDYASSQDEDSGYRELIRGNFSGIVEPHRLDQVAAHLTNLYNKKVFTAVATGFATIHDFRTDAQFPLSDHADLKQTMEYIDATCAKRIMTYGGAAETLAENLVKEGYNAQAFPKMGCMLKMRQKVIQ